MDDIKSAVTRLEESVVSLETAVHRIKKTYMQTTERSDELKEVVKTAYARVDKILTALKGGE